MKRTLSIILVAVFMLALCVPAFAEGNQHDAMTTNDGKITINNAAVGEEYAVYQMAVLESFSGTSYSYWVPEVWRAFFTTEAAKKFFAVTTDGYLGTTAAVMDQSNKETMVKDALKYIADKNIQPSQKITATSTTVVFETLDLGYYLVDSSLGTLCNLGTTNKEITIQDKNSGPIIKKEVQEDSGSAYGDTNDADMFHDIQFRMVLDCQKGAQNYVVHDIMTNMVFNADSLKIYNGSPLADDSNLVKAEGNYVLSENADCGEGKCSFHIAFTQAFCDTFLSSTDLYIYYTASLTEDAVVGGEGNPNETYVTYGNKQESVHDTTTTYTYRFQMVKTDSYGRYLDGATFSLWDAIEGGNRIPLVKVNDNGLLGGPVYRIAKAGETETVIEIPGGKPVTVMGLDGRTNYFLQEEAAPEGYNRLTSRKTVALANANIDITPDSNHEIYSGSEGGIQVINKTGAILPETGGVGTTMFILIGSILVMGTGILLFTKLKMSKIED